MSGQSSQVELDKNNLPSKAQIEKWKAKHGAVWRMKFKDESAYFKKPDRKTLKHASATGTGSMMDYFEVITKDCFLWATDSDILMNDDFLNAAGGKIGELIEVEEVELEKL